MINYVHAKKKDLIYIKKFISNNYKNNHILIKNRNLFNFYFLDKYKNNPQFLLAKDSKKQIIAILGYITNHQFDSKIKIKSLWLALWIAKKQYSNIAHKEFLLYSLLTCLRGARSGFIGSTCSNRNDTTPCFLAMNLYVSFLNE